MTTQTLAPEAGRRSDRTAWSPDRRALTAGLLLTVGTGAFEALGVGTVMPAANAELHDLHHYGLVFSAFMLTQLLGVVAGGRLADSTSPQRPFVGGTLLFAGGLLVTGTAGSMLAMALGRGLQGLGAGAVSGLAMYAVRRCYAAPARPRMLALLSTAYTVPGLVGPSIAAAVAGTVGWRWVFLGLAPVMPVAALLALPSLRRAGTGTGRPGGRLVDRSVAALAAGVALGLYALASAAGAPAVLAGLLAAGLGVPALGAALPAGTIRLRAGQPAAVAFICCAAVAYFSVDAFLPLSLTSVHGSSVAAAGLILSTGTVFWAAGTWLQARLITRVSPRPLLAGGAVTLAAGVGSTGFVMTTAWVPFGLAAVSWALVALGMGITSSTATLVVLNWAGPGSEGRASAAAQLANLLGGAAGTGLAGLKIASATDRPSLTTDVRLVALAAFGFALVTAVASARARPAPASPNPSDPKGVREG